MEEENEYYEASAKTLLSASALEQQDRLSKSKTMKEPRASGCCFSFRSSDGKKKRKSQKVKTKGKISIMDEDLSPFASIFQQVRITTSEIPWVARLLEKCIKLVTSLEDKINQTQRDFKLKSQRIYETKHQFGIKIRKSVQEEQLEQAKRDSMINSSLTDIQQAIFEEIESDVKTKGHLVMMLNSEFQKSFQKKYHQFVNKKMIPENEQLLENIIKQTVGLQSQYVFKMAEQISSEPDVMKIERDLERKKEITLANQALDEVKDFHRLMFIFTIRLYSANIKPNDLQEINEDLSRMLVNAMISNEVYNSLVFLMRIDNFEQDKDMRLKYQILKQVNAKTFDFGIPSYLNMSDPITLLEELQRVSGKQTTLEGKELANAQNTTVQNFDVEDVENVEFKEYLRSNLEMIKKLPYEQRVLIIQKSRVKPFKKSVQAFRQIMLEPCSPLIKLFKLQKYMQATIPEEIFEYWQGAIKDISKLQINRDDYNSILLFIISKAQVPDLITQLKFLNEFTSEDIQTSSRGYTVSNTYTQLYSTVKWISSLEAGQLYDKSYLLKANVEIKEDEVIRYDRIKFQEGNDHYDPFSVDGGSFLEVNSYLDPKQSLILPNPIGQQNNLLADYNNYKKNSDNGNFLNPNYHFSGGLAKRSKQNSVREFNNSKSKGNGSSKESHSRDHKNQSSSNSDKEEQKFEGRNPYS